MSGTVAAISAPRRSDASQRRLLELVEQTPRFPQVRRVEALAEPAVDRGQQVLCLGPFALLAPQPTQARRRAQLPQLRTLLPGHSQSSPVAGLRLGPPGLGKGQQQLAPEP